MSKLRPEIIPALPQEPIVLSEKPVRKTFNRQEYTYAQHEACRESYLMLGRDRSLLKVGFYAGVKLSTLKGWSTSEHWDEWVNVMEGVLNDLALKGLYDAGVANKCEEAKATLIQIIRRGSELLEEKKIMLRAADITTAAKLLLDLQDETTHDEKLAVPDWPTEVESEKHLAD
jgi:hypothetical protein